MSKWQKTWNGHCIKKYPKERIIVWAANEHIAKYADSNTDTNRREVTMGSYFSSNSLNSKTYILGFDSYSGETGRVHLKKSQVRKPMSGGFETWINENDNYAFVDFKKFHEQFPDKKEEFYLKALGHQTFFKKDWSQVFDGIFFIRHMYSCQK